LRQVFPNTKFKVRSQVFEQGDDAVRITWIDGPVVARVDEIVKDYCYGFYDYHNDKYVVSNKKKHIPQTKYVSTYRSMSNETEDKIVALLRKKYPKDCAGKSRNNYISRFNTSMLQLIWREFYDMDLYNSKTGT